MPSPNQSYKVTSSGQNSQSDGYPNSTREAASKLTSDFKGNHYCSRDYGSSAQNSNSYHYSNTNGSYYYSNPNGSTYYNNGNGASQYTPPSGSGSNKK